jgi:hypothetical protein
MSPIVFALGVLSGFIGNLMSLVVWFREHGAKEDKPPQEVKKDADKTVSPAKPA